MTKLVRRFSLALAVLGLAALASPALAQPLAPHAVPDAGRAGGAGGPGDADGAIPDVPSGPATLRGRVVHPQRPEAAAGVPIILYALNPSGQPGLRGLEADADGAFAFEGIANDPETVYLLGARYRGVPFGLRVSFEGGQLERVVELPIDEPTTDSAGAFVAESTMRIDPSCTGVYVRESHVVENPSDHVIFIPESERAGREPIVRVELPAGAGALESAPEDNLEWDGRSIRFWGPLRPGREELVFAYGITAPTDAAPVRRAFASGTRKLRVLSHPEGVTVRDAGGGAKLVAGEDFEIEGERFAALEASDLEPGATLAIQVDPRPAAVASGALEALQARRWLELDGAALTVDEQYQLAASRSLVSTSGTPLLCLDLPAGAEDLRFSGEALALGLSRDPSGALAVRGPIPAGETNLALRYRVPSEGDSTTFTRSFPLRLPLLTVLVADTGLDVATDRLHRRRFMRANDRTYLYFEGFEIAAGEAITLGLEPIATRARLPQLAASGFAVGAALLAIAYLASPLRRRTEESDAASLATSHLSDEREAVLATIRSLEDDFETGKLSEAEYDELRGELRAEAIELLRAERAAGPDATQGQPQATACTSCAAALVPGARFCSQCGAKLDAAPAPSRTGAPITPEPEAATPEARPPAVPPGGVD